MAQTLLHRFFSFGIKSKIRIRIFIALLAFSALLGLLAKFQPEIAWDIRTPARVLLSINYQGGENTFFYFEPNQSMGSSFQINSQIENFNAGVVGSACYSKNTIDLKPFLKSGINTLELKLIGNSKSEVSIGPVLWGPHGASNLICWGLVLVAGFLIWTLAEFSMLSLPSKIFLLLSLPYFLYWLKFHPNWAYTNDLAGHLAYINHMVQNNFNYFSYHGRESFQSPLYYFISSGIYIVAGHFKWLNPLSILRLFSLTLYMGFLFWGVRDLQENNREAKLNLAVGSMLLIFWPVGILMATRINNDIALYPAWAATIYYLNRWNESKKINYLSTSIVCLAIAAMIKSNAIVIGSILVATVSIEALLNGFSARYFIERGFLVSLVLLGLGIAVNLSRPLHSLFYFDPTPNYPHFGFEQDFYPGPLHFLSMNFKEFFKTPFIKFPAERLDLTFFNYFLRTSLFGEFTFRHKALASALTALLLFHVSLVSGIVSFMVSKKWRELYPHLIAVFIPLLSLMVFMTMKHWSVAQDFRFVLPLLIPYSILFVKSMDYVQNKAWNIFYWVGLGSAVALTGSSVIFYLKQYLIYF